MACDGAAAAAAERDLIFYLEERYAADKELVASEIQAMLSKAPKGFSWSLRTEDGMPHLHLAAMNEATEPEELIKVIHLLCTAGAPPDAKDEDGDSALAAVVSLTEDADRGTNTGTETREAAAVLKRRHMAAVQALIRWPATTLGPTDIKCVCSWLRRYIAEENRQEILDDLIARVGEKAVKPVWTSEMFLDYLENIAYEEKQGVQAQRVLDFLAAGARPGHSQNGATALLLVVLNPYSAHEELEQIFGAMLEIEPAAAAVLDDFKLAPIQWASDYTNIAQQHGLACPNPAAFLALLPAMVRLLPPEIDAGEACFKVFPVGGCPTKPPKNAPATRFLEGHRVVCRVESPGGAVTWEEGVVVGMWYREECWPAEHPGAPYEVLLDIGTKVYALVDHDRLIRDEAAVTTRTSGPAAPSSAQQGAPFAPPPRATAAASKAQATKQGSGATRHRFQKRQREDGKWELLDKVSGKARPCSPPESDDDG